MPQNTEKMIVGMGGFINIVRGGGNTSVVSGGSSGPGVENIKKDVSKWMLQIKPRNTEVTHSGCGGAITRKTVAQDWKGRFEAPYFNDRNFLQDLEQGKEIGVEFVFSDGTIYLGLAISDGCTLISDSTGVDVVRVSAEFVGAGRLTTQAGSVVTDPIKITQVIPQQA